MNVLILMIVCVIGYIIAYHTYGRFLGYPNKGVRRIKCVRYFFLASNRKHPATLQVEKGM